jgi:hypothetical protein
MAVTVGRGEDAQCWWGEKMGLEKKKGEMKGFLAAVTVRRGHATGFGRGSWRRCRWREGEWVFGGKFLEGDGKMNVRRPVIVLICVSFKKKKM